MNELAVQEATMRSTELHQIVFDNTGKFKKLGDFHRKVLQVLENHHDAILASSIKDSRGYVKYYNLNELQANMVMASIDVNHLEDVSKIFVHVKNHGYPQAVPELSDQVLLAQIDLERLRLTEHTKQLAIEAKVKLGKRTTNIKRIPKCPNEYTNMKQFEGRTHDEHTPLPLSFLKSVLHFYAEEIDTRGNCIHEEQFTYVLNRVLDNLVEDGKYLKDKRSDIRICSSKLTWRQDVY
jgi:hypothetical protein